MEVELQLFVTLDTKIGHFSQVFLSQGLCIVTYETKRKLNKHGRSPDTRTEMYADRVA